MDNSIIESFIRKQKVAFICSVDEDGLEYTGVLPFYVYEGE